MARRINTDKTLFEKIFGATLREFIYEFIPQFLLLMAALSLVSILDK